MRTWIDRGGTFTDVVQLDDDGRLSVRKVPSDVAVIGELAAGETCFGTTVATNALLERTGRRTLVIVDEGLEDGPWIGDMTRPALFDPDVRRRAPLCERAVGCKGRIDAEGRVIEALELPDPDVLQGMEAVAIVRLNSHRNPVHEKALAKWVRASAPGLFVALGHVVVPELGWLARLETTLVHAALTPVLQEALTRDRIPKGARAMCSDGTRVDGRALTAPDAVLSGPAGGVLAVQAIARRLGFGAAVGLDMGGTSTDVCRVDGELPRRTGRVEVAGIHLARPMLAVDTIAAGGGSILSNDGTRLAVGPRSAGAHPGPQCYGRGGPPTLTDAAVKAGLVDPAAFDPPLDPSHIDLPGKAQAFLEVAREQMAGAIRRLALREGADVADHLLVAFGGAAGQHAAGVAERLGIRAVALHPCAAVLSAWGQSLAVDGWSRTVDLQLPLARREDLERAVERVLEDAPSGRVTVAVVLQERGTGTALRRPLADSVARQQEDFVAAFRERFGFAPSNDVEVARAEVRVLGDAPAPVPGPPFQVAIRPGVDEQVLHLGSTSVWVPAGWRARVHEGVLLLEWMERPVRRPVLERSAGGIALWAARFMAVAEAGGAVLQRISRSINVRERLDFSCAVFDAHGHLVANAPHIPVHLGAMGETVRSLIAERDPSVGTSWLCNAPDAGGSHLPDLTVVTAGRLDGRRVFVASRAHHVDVGGTTPGSMPPHARSLDEEGVVFRHVALSVEPDLSGTRYPSIVRADLRAQVAANRAMLAELAPQGAAARVWMGHLLDAVEEQTRRWIERLPEDLGTAIDDVEGVCLQVRATREKRQLVLDFTGTGPAHAGNLNATPAVVRAAVLYAVRVMSGMDLPLNEGAFRAIDLRLPPRSLVDPPPGAAVAGGNVETSQRIADLLLELGGWCARSAGTMSNLTLGGDGWAFYETLGAGQGGTHRGPGASARQLHMTNTRITDPEVLEHRVPLRVRRLERRRGSGGAGEHPGGDGLVRELEVLERCTAALLATRRRNGPSGRGGGSGTPGCDEVCVDGTWRRWDGRTVALQPGDRVRVSTPGGGGWSSLNECE